MLLRKCDDVLVEIQRRNMRGRVRRIVDDQCEWLWNGVAHSALQWAKECLIWLDIHGADNTASHQEAKRMDWVSWIRAEDDVSRCSDSLRHIGETFLGSKCCNHLRVWIELHTETAGVVICLRTAKARNTLR